MATDSKPDLNPLVERVDALLKRHQESRRGTAEDLPVLTEIIDPDSMKRAPGVDQAALEAIAVELERAVLERFGPEIDRVIEHRLGRTLTELTEQLIRNMRQELTTSVRQMVREAVAASVARALASQPPEERDGNGRKA